MSAARSNFDAARSFADFGLERKRQGRRESASGPGSSRNAARPTLKLLRATLRQHSITSILDLGCGDWNWMQHLRLPEAGTDRQISYEGWDASPTLITALNEQFGIEGKIAFKLSDITAQALPKVDLIIIRDVLFHLPLEHSIPLLQRIRESCRYMIATAFLGSPENSDIASYMPIDGWGFYPINLNAAPFNMSEDMWFAAREPECDHKGLARFVCLYKFENDTEEPKENT